MRTNKRFHAQAWVTAAVAAWIFGAGSARAATYAGGSLIIPMQSVFQDACGVVSAYGLVYNVLRANDGLTALGKPRITIHWAYKATKASPNRCVPTDQSRPPIYGSYSPGNLPPWNDPIWNDGCDFRVTDSSSVPVKLINNSTGAPADDTLITTINTTADTTVYPGYPSVTITQVGASKVTSVGYLGGPFVIGASDANTFLQLLSGSLVVQDKNGNNVDFTAYRTAAACSTNGLGTANPGHYVNVHRALVAFSADDNTSFNATPPRVALQETGTSVANGTLSPYMTNAGLGFTGAFGCPANGTIVANASWKATFCPTGQQGQIFDYFDTADFANSDSTAKTLLFATDAKGNPLYQAIWTPHWGVGLGFTPKLTTPTGVGLKTTTGTLPIGTYAYRVTAVNQMGGETLPSTEVAATTKSAGGGITVSWTLGASVTSYKVYGRTTGAEQNIATVTGSTTSYTDTGAIAPSGPLPTSDTTGPPGPPVVVKALKNIASFLNGQTGLYAQCASIEAYEGETTDSYAAAQGAGIQFQTCAKDATNPSVCSSTAPQYGVSKNITGSPSNGTTAPGSYVRNCTDPTATAGAACEYFPNPGDAFMQIGDAMWFSAYGAVANYVPATGNIYKPGTLNLAYNVASLDKTKLTSPTTARTMMISDEATRSNYNSNPTLANILYLAGHTYDKWVSGNRVVLGSLLQLGLVYQSAETGYAGPTLYNNSVFVPTYDRIMSAPTSASVKKFDPNMGSAFLFPYHTGHLKTHSLSSGLVQGNNDFAKTVQWDAKNAMPAPGSRNVFTYVGGYLSLPANNLARQAGWQPVDFDYASVQSPVTTCVDNWSVGRVAKNVSTNKPGPYAGMTVGSNGVCDLEELLAANAVLTAADFGIDQGASEQAAIKTKLLDTAVNAAVQVTQQITQLIRGYCFATVGGKDGAGAIVTNPTAAQCNTSNAAVTANKQDNINTLGGFVHSQVAVVAPSQYVIDAGGKHRPTVAYAGGLDGQLHAFYVPGPDTNDTGYTGPANSLHLPFIQAKGVFHKDWLSTGSFTPPAALTELWSFIPPGQVPFLYSNDATVDSSPAVLDVFADFEGKGIREWHTVLVASAGGSNREIFALDVSNPLAPALLWDIQSGYDSTIIPYAPVPVMDDDTGTTAAADGSRVGLVAGEEAFVWQNHCRASASSCKAASFALPPLTDLGRTTSGWFNYQHLGASQSVQAALLRRNNAPVFAAFVSTNEPGGNGAYVFAIDISTGQKIWEFANPYDKASDPSGMADGVDNTPPSGVSLYSKAGTSLIDTVYAGDLEGSLWELDAADGLNQTSYAQQLGTTSCTVAGNCNFALSNAFGYDPNGYPQPITTLSTIFLVPSGLSSTSPLANYVGQPMLAYGTAGSDKVSSLAYTVTGSVHLLPLNGAGRLSAMDVLGPPSKLSTASSKGVAKEITGYPQYVATGERLYGSITAAGDHLYFATTSGSVTNIDSRGSLGGSTYSVDLTASLASGRSALTSSAGGAGGTVLVATDSTGTTRVITITDQTINVSAPQTGNLQASQINGVNQTPTSFLGWFLKKTGHEY